MASIQDIETRVIVLEDKVEFLLSHVPVNIKLPNGSIRVGTMLDLYRMSKATGQDPIPVPLDK